MKVLNILLVAFVAIVCTESCDEGFKEADLEYVGKSPYELSSSTKRIEKILKGSDKTIKGDGSSSVVFTIKAKKDKRTFDVKKICFFTKCVSTIFVEIQGPYQPPVTYLDENGNVAKQSLGPALAIAQENPENPCKKNRYCLDNLGKVSLISVNLTFASDCRKCKRIKTWDLFMDACIEKK